MYETKNKNNNRSSESRGKSHFGTPRKGLFQQNWQERGQEEEGNEETFFDKETGHWVGTGKEVKRDRTGEMDEN